MEIETTLVIPGGNGFQALIASPRHDIAPGVQESSFTSITVNDLGEVTGATRTRKRYNGTREVTRERVAFDSGTRGQLFPHPTNPSSFILRLTPPATA